MCFFKPQQTVSVADPYLHTLTHFLHVTWLTPPPISDQKNFLSSEGFPISWVIWKDTQLTSCILSVRVYKVLGQFDAQGVRVWQLCKGLPPPPPAPQPGLSHMYIVRAAAAGQPVPAVPATLAPHPSPVNWPRLGGHRSVIWRRRRWVRAGKLWAPRTRNPGCSLDSPVGGWWLSPSSRLLFLALSGPVPAATTCYFKSLASFHTSSTNVLLQILCQVNRKKN